MSRQKLDRFSSLKLAAGQTLRNRVVIPPMASQTAGPRGEVTAETLAHYQRLAEARPSLLIVEYTYIDDSGKSEDRQLGIQSPEQVGGLTGLAREIKSSGALAGIQLTHAGAKTERSMTGGVLMAPSRIAVPVKDRQMEVPDPMSLIEMMRIKQGFLIAVERAVHSGFDLVEFHAAHGYGLNQWLSPITNQRTDDWGGALQSRMRLLLEIVRETRDRYPELLISVRMPGRDFLVGGLELEDTQMIAQTLERAGVSILHVSSGIGGWRRPSDRTGEGYLVNEAAQIQSVVSIPVIGVGGIESGAYIDSSLQTGDFSLAAVGRAILKGPAEWAQIHLSVGVSPFFPTRGPC